MISCPHHSFLSHAGGEKETGGEQERGRYSWAQGSCSWSTTPALALGPGRFQGQH